ncbi:MAG: hypothetical protein KAS66_10645 [Candidatus Omnitrophica bacterium]|nr:hypothetical protein [Candidatus Omnitrophota bacterium]
MFLKWVHVTVCWELKHWFGFGRTCALAHPDGRWEAWDKDRLSTSSGKCDYIYQGLREARLSIKGKTLI